MHSAGYVFGSEGVINSTGGWPTGVAFLLGLLSVQWTMTDYDASARGCFLFCSYSLLHFSLPFSRHLVRSARIKPFSFTVLKVSQRRG